MIAEQLESPPGLYFWCHNTLHSCITHATPGPHILVFIVLQLTLYGEAEFSLIFGAQPKCAAFLPIMVGISLVTYIVAAGFMGGALGHSFITAKDCEDRLQITLESTSASLASLQCQHTSLTQVALQNRRALDLLTAEKGGLLLPPRGMLSLCHESGIVELNVKKLTNLAEDLLKRPTKKHLNQPPKLSSHHLAPAFLGPFAHAHYSMHPPTLFTTISQIPGKQNL
jgi:hypothetical protein